MRSRTLPQQKFSKAYGRSPAKNREGSGIVYEDSVAKATKEVVRFKTTSEENKIIKKLLEEELGETGPYNVLSNNCRNYSMYKFKQMRSFIKFLREQKRK